jgi:hypothetical protein
VRRPPTPRFGYDRQTSGASDAPRADAVQVLQAAQQREGCRQGRRAAGADGVAPAAGRGAGCHGGRGRGSGERSCLLVAERRVGRVDAESIPSVPELKPLELGEGSEGPGEARGALWADAVIPAGGAWGKPRSGQAWPLGASLAGKPCRERSKETPEAALQRHRPASADIHWGACCPVTALPAHALRFAVRLHRPEMARH